MATKRKVGRIKQNEDEERKENDHQDILHRRLGQPLKVVQENLSTKENDGNQ